MSYRDIRSVANKVGRQRSKRINPLRIKLTAKFLGHDAHAAICIFKRFDKQVHPRAVSAFAIKTLIA